MMTSATSREAFRTSTYFRRSLIPKQAVALFSKSWNRSASKAFSLILRSNSSQDLLVDWPPKAVEVLRLLLVELPLALIMAFRYSTGFLFFSASSSSEERASMFQVEVANSPCASIIGWFGLWHIFILLIL